MRSKAMLRLDHVLILAQDLDRTSAFLAAAAGLDVGPRPAFPFDGVWLYGEGHPLVHLARAGDFAHGDYLDVSSAGGTGPVDHIAFAGADYAALIARLTGAKLPFFERTVPQSRERQVFVPGPDGLKLEFLFPERTVP